MDLDSFLVELYVVIDAWWQDQPPMVCRGRPARLHPSELLTLAVLAQWPRWRSERDFWRFADARLRALFPALPGQSQFNRRVRAAEPLLHALQTALAGDLADPAAVYRVLDTTLIPAIERVRACRRGLFAGAASFGRCASKTTWVYGFKVGLVVDPTGVVTTFGLAPANSDERPIGDALVVADHFPSYLADKGFAAVDWERHWRDDYGVTVAATPTRTARRAWPEPDCRWAAGKRQVVEQVIGQIKDQFGLERHRAKTLGGMLARVTAKITADTCGLMLNRRHGRPLRHLASLLIA